MSYSSFRRSVQSGVACAIALSATLAVARAPLADAAPAYDVKPIGTAENDRFSFGKVVLVGRGRLVIREYSFTKDCDINVAYVVTRKTEYGNINSLRQLKRGDDVVLDYTVQQGRRVVTTIVKEEKTAEH